MGNNRSFDRSNRNFNHHQSVFDVIESNREHIRDRWKPTLPKVNFNHHQSVFDVIKPKRNFQPQHDIVKEYDESEIRFRPQSGVIKDVVKEIRKEQQGVRIEHAMFREEKELEPKLQHAMNKNFNQHTIQKVGFMGDIVKGAIGGLITEGVIEGGKYLYKAFEDDKESKRKDAGPPPPIPTPDGQPRDRSFTKEYDPLKESHELIEESKRRDEDGPPPPNPSSDPHKNGDNTITSNNAMENQDMHDSTDQQTKNYTPVPSNTDENIDHTAISKDSIDNQHDGDL